MLLLHQRQEYQSDDIATTLLLTGSSDRTILVSLHSFLTFKYKSQLDSLDHAAELLETSVRHFTLGLDDLILSMLTCFLEHFSDAGHQVTDLFN